MTLVLKKSKRRNKCALINASFNGGHHNTVCCVLRARYALEEEKNDIPVLQNLDVRWLPIMHFTFYLVSLSTPFATNEHSGISNAKW